MPAPNTGVCLGDSGGPLVINSATGQQVGIASYANSCASSSPQTPQVFTNIACPAVRTWIKAVAGV